MNQFVDLIEATAKIAKGPNELTRFLAKEQSAILKADVGYNWEVKLLEDGTIQFVKTTHVNIWKVVCSVTPRKLRKRKVKL